MHELSVATSLVECAERAAADAGVTGVVAVHVRLGRLSGLVPDSLVFGFEVAAAGTSIAGARLVLERVEPLIWCPRCEAAVALAAPTRFRCVTCGTPSAEIVAGKELELRSLEVADEPLGASA
jgi:hydrogenase nickel incorporation protein HypA/HybF